MRTVEKIGGSRLKILGDDQDGTRGTCKINVKSVRVSPSTGIALFHGTET